MFCVSTRHPKTKCRTRGHTYVRAFVSFRLGAVVTFALVRLSLLWAVVGLFLRRLRPWRASVHRTPTALGESFARSDAAAHKRCRVIVLYRNIDWHSSGFVCTGGGWKRLDRAIFIFGFVRARQEYQRLNYHSCFRSVLLFSFPNAI